MSITNNYPETQSLNKLNKSILDSKGFDRLFNQLAAHSIGLDKRLKPFFFENKSHSNFPPYNIVKETDNNYQIEVALAGYAPEDIAIEKIDTQLVVSSVSMEEKQVDSTEPTRNMIHHGIAKRNFSLKFVLDESMEIKQASMKNGMLVIDLERIIPEEKLPKRISIISF